MPRIEEEQHQWTPEEEAAARRARAALDRALSQIRSEKQADEILERIERLAGEMSEQEVADRAITPPTSEEKATVVEQAAELGPEEAIAEAAKQLASADLEASLVLDEAVGRKTEEEKVEDPETHQGRDYLRRALMRRLKPYDAVDASVFLRINGLPHPKAADFLFSRLSWVMTAGYGWLGLLTIGALFIPNRVAKSLPFIVPALWLSTAIVEFGIKRIFRRKRPFISIVRAVVVGRKPGSYSFPSGHSAAAFAGAKLMAREFPEYAGLFRAVAMLTAFSRIYLGKHYPGDVVAGSLAGEALAGFFQQCFKRRDHHDGVQDN